MALKIIAARIALRGVAQPMTFNADKCGVAATNTAEMIAKYFATSLEILKVIGAPRVITSRSSGCER